MECKFQADQSKMYRWDGSFDFKRREDWDYKSETHGLLAESASWKNARCFDMANIGNVGIAGSPISLVKHQCFARPELHSVHVGPSMSIRGGWAMLRHSFNFMAGWLGQDETKEAQRRKKKYRPWRNENAGPQINP